MELEERTLPRAVAEKAERNEGKTFILFGDERISYSDFHERSNRVANSLLELGMKKGDKASILMSNGPEYLYAWIGLAKIGALEVPIHPEFKGRMLLYRLDHSDAKMLFTEPEFLPTLAAMQSDLTKIKDIILTPEMPRESLLPEDSFGIHSFGRLLRGSREDVSAHVGPEDPFAIMFTSGTTGQPKGAVLPHAWNFYAGRHKVDVMGTTSDDVIFNCFPMCNPTGQLETTFTAMMADASVAHVKRFSASNFWNECRRSGATEFVYMGGILTLLLKQPESGADRDHSIKTAWGAGCSKPVWLDFERRFGVRIIEIYGTTETMQVHQTPRDAPRPGSCGMVVEDWEARIVGEDNGELPHGSIGEIVARPRKPEMMFLGYYRDKEATLEALRGSWFHTGDLGYRDEEGYFYFYQRKKYAMRIKGRMVSTWEIEQTINAHSKVRESVVFGVPSELGEEECKVIVVLKPGETLRPEELLDYCQERMPYYMVPRYLELTHDELRKTHTERIVVWEYQKEGVGRAWDRETAGYRIRR